MIEAEPGTSLLRVRLARRATALRRLGHQPLLGADRVGRWSGEGIARVADALLDDEVGLGYTIFRYNIGGGENPAHDHMDQYKDIEGFQAPDGAFDWDGDPHQAPC